MTRIAGCRFSSGSTWQAHQNISLDVELRTLRERRMLDHSSTSSARTRYELPRVATTTRVETALTAMFLA